MNWAKRFRDAGYELMPFVGDTAKVHKFGMMRLVVLKGRPDLNVVMQSVGIHISDSHVCFVHEGGADTLFLFSEAYAN